MSKQSALFDKQLSELMPGEASRKKLELIATQSAYSLGFEQSLSDAVDSLFIEYALDESFNSDDPWCVIAILAAIDGVIEGGPYHTDSALIVRRNLYVRKVFEMVQPLCKTSTAYGLDEWLSRISYSEDLCPECLAVLWDRSSPVSCLSERTNAFDQNDPMAENEQFFPHPVWGDSSPAIEQSPSSVFVRVREKVRS